MILDALIQPFITLHKIIIVLPLWVLIIIGYFWLMFSLMWIKVMEESERLMIKKYGLFVFLLVYPLRYTILMNKNV